MRISAVYIVKDEAAELERSLAALAQNVDEIVVVQTCDAPPVAAVGKKFGAKLAFFAWCGDFAAARNFAIEQATGDWIVMPDADEYFPAALAKNLRAVVDQADRQGVDALALHVVNVDGSEETDPVLLDFIIPRLFRRRADIRYRGAIHEELVSATEKLAKALVPPTMLKLIHTGYRKAVNTQKAARNLELLQAELAAAEKAGDKQQIARCHAYIADCYDDLDDIDRAMEYARLAIASRREGVGTGASFASRSDKIVLKHLAQQPEKIAERYEAARIAAEDFPRLPELQAEAAVAAAAVGDYAAAVKYARQAQDAADIYGDDPNDWLEPSDIDKAQLKDLARLAARWQKILRREQSLKISACAIVKNEARDLPRWLESAKGFSDEIVVVDTGSTDDTVAIAAAAGARVENFAWRDDFSAAKNYAVSQANGDWIAMIDADESWLDPSLVRPFIARLEVEQPQVEAIFVTRLDVDEDDNDREILRLRVLRLFRRRLDLRYEGNVHETLVKDRGRLVSVYAPELQLRHTGYSTRRVQAKAARNRRLLEQDIAQNGEQPRHYRYLADCYMATGDWAKVRHYAELAIKAPLQAEGCTASLYHNLLTAVEKLAEPAADRLAIAEEALNRFQRLPDFHAECGYLLREMGLLPEAAQCIENALALAADPANLTEEESFFLGSVHVAYWRLAQIKQRLGDSAAAKTAIIAALRRQPRMSALLDTYNVIAGDVPPTEFLAGLDGIFDASSAADLAFLRDWAETAPCLSLYRFINEKLGTDNAPPPRAELYEQAVAGEWEKLDDRLLAMTSEAMQLAFAAALPVIAAPEPPPPEMLEKLVAVLPSSLGALLPHFLPGAEPLTDKECDTLLLLLPSCLRVATPPVIERVLQLLEPQPGATKVAAADVFRDLYHFDEALSLYGAVPANDPAVDGKFWYGAGITLYCLGDYAAACAALAKAKELPDPAPDIDSFIVWSREKLNETEATP